MSQSPGPPTPASSAPRWRTLLAALAWSAAALCALQLVRWGVEKWVWPSDPWLLVGTAHLPFTASPTTNSWASLGTLTGMVVGFLAGVRSRSLLGWVVGPSVGMGVAMLHYFTCTWLVGAGMSESLARLVPTSGLVVGWILGWGRRSEFRASMVLVALALADSAGRWAGAAYLRSHLDCGVYPLDFESWLITSGPLAIAIVLAAGRGRSPTDPAPGAPRLSPRWRGLGLALLLFVAGLWGADAYGRSRVAPVGGERLGPLPDDCRQEWMARDCAVLDRALRGLGLRPQVQASPPGRNFRDYLRAFDADRRLGYLILPRQGGHLHSIEVGEVPGRSGLPVPVCILVEPWIQDASMVLLLHEDDLESDDDTPFYTPDLLEAEHLTTGRTRSQRLARASEVERIVAGFTAAVSRRDVGTNPVVPRAGPPHLIRLIEEYAPLQSDLQAARKRQIATGTMSAQVVRIRVDADGCAHVLVVPGTRYPALDGRMAEGPGMVSPRTDASAYFWINDEGKIIGDKHEIPPDGHPVVDWHVPIRSRWVELVEEGAAELRIDLGPEAEAIVMRRNAESR